jgi:hypothetical protein
MLLFLMLPACPSLWPCRLSELEAALAAADAERASQRQQLARLKQQMLSEQEDEEDNLRWGRGVPCLLVAVFEIRLLDAFLPHLAWLHIRWLLTLVFKRIGELTCRCIMLVCVVRAVRQVAGGG